MPARVQIGATTRRAVGRPTRVRRAWQSPVLTPSSVGFFRVGPMPHGRPMPEACSASRKPGSPRPSRSPRTTRSLACLVVRRCYAPSGPSSRAHHSTFVWARTVRVWAICSTTWQPTPAPGCCQHARFFAPWSRVSRRSGPGASASVASTSAMSGATVRSPAQGAPLVLCPFTSCHNG
jgi:hypothetical protein